MMDIKQRAYLIPNPLVPDTWCAITVFVPNAPGYIEAFWGSLEYLSTWIAWEKDELKQARVAGQQFRLCFDASRDLWLLEGCIMFIRDIRQVPGECWRVQVSYYAGQWVDKLDFSSCPMPLTVAPIRYGEILPDERTPGQACADDMAWFFWQLIAQLSAMIDDEEPVPDILSHCISVLGKIDANADVYTPANAIVTALIDHSPAERNATLNAEYWTPFRDAAWCEGGDLAEPDDISWRQWLNDAANGIYGFLNASADWLYSALNLTKANILTDAGVSRWIWQTGGGGGGVGLGGDAVCFWQREWDYRANPGGLVLRNEDYGEWVDGVGWRASYAEGGWRLYPSLSFPETTLTYVRIAWSSPPIAPAGGTFDAINWDYIIFDEGVDGGDKIHDWKGSKVGTELELTFTSTTENPITLTALLLRGLGDNPFT
jgi:hypothetical protein